MTTLSVPSVRKLYLRTEGKAFEPRDPSAPTVGRLIDEGYVRRVDGRVGFERLKDAMLTWTQAAHAAFSEK